MSYEDTKAYVGLYPELPDDSVDEELEQAKKLSLITAREDELRRRQFVASSGRNCSLDSHSLYNSPNGRASVNGFTSSSTADEFGPAGNFPDSNKTGRLTAARPRPVGWGLDVVEWASTTMPRTALPVGAQDALRTTDPWNIYGTLAPLQQRNISVMDRIMSDQYVRLPPYPVPRSQSVALEANEPLDADNAQYMQKLPPRPPKVPNRPVAPGKAPAIPPRINTLPMQLKNESNAAASSASVFTSSDKDTDSSLMVFSPVRPSVHDFDASLYDSLRPVQYQDPLAAEVTQDWLAAELARSDSPPPIIPRNCVLVNPPVATNKASHPAFGLSGEMAALWPMPQNPAPVTVASDKPIVHVASLPSAEWPKALPVVGSSASERTTPTTLQHQFSDQMGFQEEESDWDAAEFMTLEYFDPLYCYDKSSKGQSDRKDTAEQCQDGQGSRQGSINSPGSRTGGYWSKAELFEIPAGGISGVSTTPATGLSFAQSIATDLFESSVASDFSYASVDELQNPFSIIDLTTSLEHKRRKHALERQAREEELRRVEAARRPAVSPTAGLPGDREGVPSAQQQNTTVSAWGGKASSSYEALQDFGESIADEETRVFVDVVARIKAGHDPRDRIANRGIVVSPRMQHPPYFNLTIKVSISAHFLTEPVIFTCDVNTLVEHIISRVLLTLMEHLEDTSLDNFLLKIYGLSEYLVNDSRLADYAYVQQCLKLDSDIKFVLSDLDSIPKPFLRTDEDSRHPVFMPKSNRQAGEAASRVTRENLNILMETFYKEIERLRDSAFQARSPGVARVQCSGVVQAVKALCTMLHTLETVDIYKAVRRLQTLLPNQAAEQMSPGGHTSDAAREFGDGFPVMLDDLHVTLEEMTKAVKSMIDLYCRTFHTDFRFESSARPFRDIHQSYSLHEGLIVHLATAHRIPLAWKNVHVEYHMECSLFHGGSLLSGPVRSQLQPTSNAMISTILWDEWLLFDTVLVASLPRESKLIFSLIGSRLVMASTTEGQHKVNVALCWVALQLYNQSYELVQDGQLLGMWQGSADPLGTTCSNADSPSSVLLQVNLPVFEHGYVFPDVPDPLPSVKQDFSSLHPNDQEYLLAIIEKDALTKLTSDESDYVWEKRHHLYDHARALPRVLQIVNTWAWTALRDTYAMVKEWSALQPLEALHLLLPSYADTFVRETAVRELANLSADELYDVLPQLVQALKFECYHASALAQLLLDKAASNVRIAHLLYWLLKEAADDARYRKRYQLMFGALLSVVGEGMRDEMTKQEDIVRTFAQAASATRAATRDRQVVLERELSQTWKCVKHSSVRLPLNPSIEVGGLDVKSCSFFTSNTVPLKLCLKNIDTAVGDVFTMFKVGDDMRQDMLTLQMMRIMDKLWLQDGLDLKMIIYACLPTSHKHGLVELVSNSETLAKIQVRCGHGVRGAFKVGPIADWLQQHNPTELDYQKAVDNFTLSCAGYCVATYVLGIGDRHNDNIMIKHSGHIFHIDFAKFLGDAQKFGNIKRDRTPFVLTSDMVYVINGGDKPTQKFQQFVDLCCCAFNILRKNADLFFNLFSLMTLSGIPGVTEGAPRYIQKVLLPDRTDAEAVADFTQMIDVCVQSVFVRVNFFIHNLAQMKFGHDDGMQSEGISFIPKIFSVKSDARIRKLEITGVQKRYSPEKFYVYIVRVERENERVASLVMRRYSEFQELHRKLILSFPLAHLPPLSNKLIVGRAHVRQVAEARKVELDTFLHDLMTQPKPIKQHDLVYTFFHPIFRDEQDVDKVNIPKLKDTSAGVGRNRSSSVNSIEGTIKLNLFYRGDTLTIMVIHVKDLGKTAAGGTPNPYVKLYLLPDSIKMTKRKTKIVRSTFDPTYNEMITYRVPSAVLKLKTLQVTVWSYEPLSENEFLGAVHIPLVQLDTSREWVGWHQLQTLHNISLHS